MEITCKIQIENVRLVFDWFRDRIMANLSDNLFAMNNLVLIS